MAEMPALHVRTLGDGAWGVFTPAADGTRLLARCGGPDAEANARLFARAPALREAAAPFVFALEWAFSGGKTLTPNDQATITIRVKAGDLRRLAEAMEAKS